MFFKKFLAFLHLAAGVIPMVVAAENAIGAGQGSHKLNLVLSTVQAADAMDSSVSTALGTKDLTQVTTSIVNGTVGVLNAAGVFTKPGA